MSNILLAEDVAREYWRTNSFRQFGNARELVGLIDSFMTERALAKSTISRIDVAHHVLDLQRQQAVAQAEAEAVFRANVQQGTTADDQALRYADELVLAGQVQQMDLETYGQNRERLGVSQSLGSFLMGRNQ